MAGSLVTRRTAVHGDRSRAGFFPGLPGLVGLSHAPRPSDLRSGRKGLVGTAKSAGAMELPDGGRGGGGAVIGRFLARAVSGILCRAK